MKISKIQIAIYLMIAAGFILSMAFYDKLPDSMASHWNAKGQVDDHMSKSVCAFLMPGIMFFIVALFAVIVRIDPLKANIEKFRNYYEGFILFQTTFLLVLHIWMLLWNTGVKISANFIMPLTVGGLYFFLGMIFGKIKRNWFIGIRTPWTLSNEVVWRRTHEFTGTLFKAAGLIAMVGALFTQVAIWFVLVPILAVAVIITIYSYVIYKKVEAVGIGGDAEEMKAKEGSGDNTWDNLKEGYLQQVEKSLMKVSSPRKKEVLEDVACHLDQKFGELADDDRTWENYQQIITDMGPAGDYGELLSPASVEANSKKFSLGKILMAVVIAVLIWMLLPYVFKTIHEAGVEVSKPDFNTDEKVEEKYIIATEDLGFKATLSDGVTVELMGICKYDNQEIFWKPDGRRFVSDLRVDTKSSIAGQERYAFFFKLNTDDFNLKFNCDGSESNSGTDAKNTVGERMEGYWVVIPDINKSLEKTNIRIGIATGQWQTIAEFDGNRKTSGSKDVVFANPIETKTGIAISVRGEFGWEGVRRIVAIDKNGKLHRGGWGGRSSGDHTISTGTFNRMSLDQIEKYQVRFRPYKFVKIGNVSLKPNSKSDPQGGKPLIPIEIDTTTRFLSGDSIEITEILGTTGKIEAGQTYLIKGKYKLSSRDEAHIRFLSTNGATACPHGPTIKRGSGEFTRTLKYLEENKGALLQAIFCPVDGGESFGDLYFYNKNSHVSDIPLIQSEAPKPARTRMFVCGFGTIK